MRLRILLTPLWLAFTLVVIAATASCLALGWWQWQRYEELGGTFQNLGYTIQWPFFAAFAVYLWWRLLRDAGADRAGSAPGAGEQDGAERGPAGRPETGQPETERPALAQPPAEQPAEADDDPELAAYNRYLAELNARTKE